MPLPLLGPLLVVTAVEPEAAAVRAGLATPPVPLSGGGDAETGGDIRAGSGPTALPGLRPAVPPAEPDPATGGSAHAVGDPAAPLAGRDPDASVTSSTPVADHHPDASVTSAVTAPTPPLAGPDLHASATSPAPDALGTAGRAEEAAADDGGPIARPEPHVSGTGAGFEVSGPLSDGSPAPDVAPAAGPAPEVSYAASSGDGSPTTSGTAPGSTAAAGASVIAGGDRGGPPAVPVDGTAAGSGDGYADEDSSTVSAGHLVDGVDTQIVVAAVGVGSAEAAAGTARLLALAEAAGRPYASVISAGIGGGLPGRAAIGDTVIAVRSIAADLGADSPNGYLPIEELGFGSSVVAADEGLSALLRESLPEALIGDVLTVNTVTGTADRASALTARHPAAVAEAMEGYGVAVAARAAGVAFAELRTISNPVGPRDRAAWNLPAAFTALTAAFSTLTSAPDQPGSD